MSSRMTHGAGKREKIVVISGPSGVGKSTICRRLVKRMGAQLSISVTTRPISPKETEGVDYYFITEEEFRNKIERGDFLEYARVFDNFYGTPRQKVEDDLNAGKTVILEIDIQGARAVRQVYPDAITVFILPPQTRDLLARMSGRARDSAGVIEKRLARANEEIAAARQFYKYMVVNNDLAQAVNEIVNIIQT